MRLSGAGPVLLLLGCVAACGPGRVATSGESSEGTSGTSGDESSGSDSGAVDSGGFTPSESETDDPDPTTAGFVPAGDWCGGYFYCTPNTCDVFEQDCPNGEKCTAYASTGGNWDAHKCVPVLGDLEPGEPCTLDDPVTAADDCGPGSMCYDGVCRSFCTGSLEDPSCAPGFGCAAGSDEDALALCLALCDPLAQDCDLGSCYWDDTQFLCNPTGEIAIGEPCGFVDDCTPGTACMDMRTLPSCDGAQCCAPLCNLDQGDCTSLPGTECLPWFEPDQAPAGLERVGVCLMP